jgi:hypothetical protein
MDIERQISDLHTNSAITHEPVTPSNLTRAQSVSEIEPTTRSGLPATAEGPKES